MASSKVTDYTEATTLAGDDAFYVVDVGSSADRFVKQSNILKSTSMIASGTIWYGNSSKELTELAQPASGAVLTFSSVTKIPAWSMPTSGAVFVGSSVGVPQWLACPSSGALLAWSSVNAAVEWSKPTSGAVMVGTSVGTPSWLAKPSSGAVLTWSSADAAVAWSVPTSGAILIASSIGAPEWLALGASGLYLQSTGGKPGWAAVAAAGGGSTAINLPAAAWQPTNNGSSWASAQLSVVQSGGSVPSPRWQEWLFDPTTIEYAVTTFIMPPNYAGASAAVLTVKYYSTAAVSSGVSWGVRIGGLPTSGAIQNWAFGATGAISTFAVPTTAYDLGSADITLTEGSSLLAAGNFQCIALYRNVGGGDSAAGDMHFVGAELKYS